MIDYIMSYLLYFSFELSRNYVKNRIIFISKVQAEHFLTATGQYQDWISKFVREMNLRCNATKRYCVKAFRWVISHKKILQWFFTWNKFTEQKQARPPRKRNNLLKLNAKIKTKLTVLHHNRLACGSRAYGISWTDRSGDGFRFCMILDSRRRMGGILRSGRPN